MPVSVMLTLHQVEERHAAIKSRLNEIFGLIRSGGSDPADFADEIATLIFETKKLSANIKYHRVLAEVLESSNGLGGPH